MMFTLVASLILVHSVDAVTLNNSYNFIVHSCDYFLEFIVHSSDYLELGANACLLLVSLLEISYEN
jgi:CRISPR/Cas system-associated protein Csx1